MKPGKIRTLVEEQVDELYALSKKVGDEFDKKTIHEFRVGVKGLRSFLRLLRTQTSGTELKIPRSFKRLYHIAGAIRDTQLELDRFSKAGAELPRYTNKLQLMLERQQKEWELFYSKKLIRKLKHRLGSSQYTRLDVPAFTDFFSDRMLSVRGIAQIKSPTDNQIHQVRKLVKDVLYTTEIAEQKWKSAHAVVSVVPVKQLEGIANEIGDYNDERTTREQLSSFSSRNIQQAELDYIRNICEEAAGHLKTKKKDLIGKIRKLPTSLPAEQSH